MITNVLDLARLDAGGVRYRFAPCDVERVVRDAIEGGGGAGGEEGLDASIEVAPGLPRIARRREPAAARVHQPAVERGQVHSRGQPHGSAALSAAHARRGDVVGAEARAPRVGAANGLPEPRWCARCGIPGPGIPDAHKEKVFERFHRVDETRRGDQ